MKTLIVDLDDTICFPNHQATNTYDKYFLARPNIDFILSLHKAKHLGYKIIIHTARRMLTHNGDIDAIIKDVGFITERWLEIYRVPYNELVFGKHYAEYYIDDKALRPAEFIRMMNV
jgi:capsule biosynthesis phosphatase